MATWRRAHRPALSTLVGLMFVIIGVGIITMMTVSFIVGSGEWQVNPVLGIVAAYGFLGLWTGFAWRMYRTGVYVSRQGLRVIHPWRNRVIPWANISGFTTGPAMLGGWATVRKALFVELAGGRLIETPLQQRAPTRAISVRKNTGPVLSAADFEATLTFLGQCLTTEKARVVHGRDR